MIDDAVKEALAHLDPRLASPDAVRLISAAISAAVEAFEQGDPSTDTAEALMSSSVGIGMAFVPSNISAEFRDAANSVLIAALGWLWREIQPDAVIVEADGTSEVVLVVDE